MRLLLYFQLTQNVRFDWNMDNFKFTFLSWGQLESLSLDKFILPWWPRYEVFLVTLVLPWLLECYAETILIYKTEYSL